MAGNAVVRERFLAVSNGLRIVRQWVFLVLVADQKTMLGKCEGSGLQLSGRVSLAARRPDEAGHGTEPDDERGNHSQSERAHHYCTTCTFKAIEPWPGPQKTEQCATKSPGF